MHTTSSQPVQRLHQSPEERSRRNGEAFFTTLGCRAFAVVRNLSGCQISLQICFPDIKRADRIVPEAMGAPLELALRAASWAQSISEVQLSAPIAHF